ncbi:MAG: flagellar M-ring protein FliF C-terminal domain-containing protein [Planctomycetota bacterium]
MKILKAQIESAREVLAALPMQSRVTMGLLVLAVVVSLGFLVRGEWETGREPLFGGQAFAETELNEMEFAFSRAGLADWKRDGTRMLVPTADKASYLAALDESKTLSMSIRSNLQEAIANSSVFESSEMQRARRQTARQQDVADNIMKFPFVRSASVQYSRDQSRGLTQDVIQSASVIVEPRGNKTLSRSEILAIQRLVRASFSGMSPEDVVVTDTNGGNLGVPGDDDPLLRKQEETEADYEEKITRLLFGLPATVVVTAEIDPTMEVEKTTLKYDPEPTTLASDTRKIESSTSVPNVSGEPGVVPNVAANRAVSLQPTETRSSKEDQRQTRSVSGQTFESSTVAAYAVRQVKVAISLPRSFFERKYVQDKLSRDPNLTADTVPPIDAAEYDRILAEETKRIQQIVAGTIPAVSAGADPTDLIKVYDYFDPPPDAAPASDTAGAVMTWLADSWQTIGMFALGFVALLVARSAAKASASPTPKDFQEGFGLELPEMPSEEELAGSEDNMTITGSTLQDELAKIVGSNPEVAANVIRGWVGDAA